MNYTQEPKSFGREEPSDDQEVAALRAILQGTARFTGEEFFQSLVRHLAAAVGTGYAFVAEIAGATQVRTLAYWVRGQLVDNVEYDVRGTPCEDVLRGDLCHHPSGVKDKFPDDKDAVDWGIESYLGVPLRDARGQVLGHLAVFDERPMPSEPRRLYTLRLFAERAAAELERLRYESRLAESEQRHRDLFEEAPIAYVLEDFESRFVSANKAAMTILGITPDQVIGTVGLSFLPASADAQRCVRENFASMGRGMQTSAEVVELRRRDDGRPIWVQLWSKPVPGGQYTRTMFVDITDRVLAEQEKARLQAQNAYLQEEIKSTHNFEEIVCRSKALTAVLDDVNRLAPTDSTVLITGETGTGKELIARAIHSASQRKDKPLFKIDCAALPPGLVESELFGHEKGAFTGAVTRRVGRLELAHGSTLFLDEVGELPLEAQAKLLRFLQEREFDRIGASTPIKADVRVLAATNRDLLRAVREKTFREDLYYRLNVIPLLLPPVRERKEDLPLLIQFLIRKYAAKVGKRIDGVSESTLRRMLAYGWPGNVRELANVLERAIVLTDSPTLEIGPDSFPVASASSFPDPAPSAPATMVEAERGHVLAVLALTGWVIEGPRGAASILGLHPNTLRSRMKKLGIHRGAHDPS
jgi:PAS domain S-box-containing protein